MRVLSISQRSLRVVAAASVAMLFAACATDSPTSVTQDVAARSQSLGSLQAAGSTLLGTASTFGVLGATTVTCTGASTVAGDVGVSPGTAITGFNPDCTLTGTLHAGDAAAATAQADAAAAYASLMLSVPDSTFGAVQELSGLTLTSGTYFFPSSAQLSAGGTLTLSGSGPFIFQVTSTFITFTGSQIVLANNAACANVYWVVGSSATLAGSVAGTVIAVTSIGMNPGASLTGQALALGGAVTMSGQNTVNLCAPINGNGNGNGNGKQKCNQGVGNGPEGCDPGNSNNRKPTNDENGGIPGKPGRKP